jgi:hypothetical protein
MNADWLFAIIVAKQLANHGPTARQVHGLIESGISKYVGLWSSPRLFGSLALPLTPPERPAVAC